MSSPNFVTILMQAFGIVPPPTNPCDAKRVCKDPAKNCDTAIRECNDAQSFVVTTCDQSKLCDKNEEPNACSAKVETCKVDIARGNDRELNGDLPLQFRSDNSPKYWFLLQNFELLNETMKDRITDNTSYIIAIVRRTPWWMLIIALIVFAIFFVIVVIQCLWIIVKLWQDKIAFVKILVMGFFGGIVLFAYVLLIKMNVL